MVFTIAGGALPALADSSSPLEASPLVAQAAQSASLTGVVRGDTGAPIGGATVTAHGATTLSTKTAADGTFTLAVVPGIYQIEVRAAGFTNAGQSDVAVTNGQSVPLTIALTRPSLSSLQTIGRTGTISRGSGGSINTGTAASGFISAQAFQLNGNPQINDVLQHLPDVTIQHMGSQPDTTIIVGGVQPYETQVLIDGHPIATGQYGVFISQYFPSYLIGGIETQSGPGNTTPFANLAVGGTANILTPSYTTRPTGEIQVGVDEYEQQFSHALFTGSAGNLQYIVGAGVDGYNGPYFQKNICNTDEGVISSCGDGSGSFFSKGELLKLRYNFSPKTSLEAGFIGAWGGYSPQGTAWGTENGQQVIPECTATSVICSNPGYSYYNGRSINSISYYPGSSVYNNQTLFDAQFRTAIGNDTLLIRPYLGNIEPENVLGAGEAYSPDFFSRPGATPVTDPAFFGDGTPANPGACANAYGSLTNGSGQGNVVNGQTECFATPYQTFEIDKLYGSTISYLHPVGDDLYNFTYDFHGDSTFAYINSPDDISVPLSSNRYSTFSLTGDIHRIRNFGIDFGVYDTLFKAIGVEPASLADPTLVGFDRSISRLDPHIAFTFRPTSSVSYRAAYGTSTTFPFLGQLSGNATYEQPAQSLGIYALGGSLTEKNANLDPEVSIAESVGMDKRYGRYSTLSVDLQNSVIHNVFENLTSSVPANGGLEGIFSPINVARLRTQLATLKYAYAPPRGLGFNANVAAERSMVDGVPASLYTQIQPGQPPQGNFPVNNVQICGNGVAAPGIPTCIPYLKGYGQFTYTFGDGSFAALGVDYEGKNNAYFQPPMAIADLTLRKRLTRNIDINMSVQNLFNTNNYGTYLATPGAGTPLVAGYTDLNGNIQQTSFTPTLVSAPARQIRISGRYHFGR